MSSATVTIASTSVSVDVFASPGNYQRTYADYLELDKALVADDLPSARRAFARLQEDLPSLAQVLSRDPFPAENPHRLALQELGRCLVTGNLRRAKQAFLRFNQEDARGPVGFAAVGRRG